MEDNIKLFYGCDKSPVWQSKISLNTIDIYCDLPKVLLCCFDPFFSMGLWVLLN